MKIKKLFEMQKALDQHIETKHQLMEENLFDRKVLALLVEVGELANETRCFKFWSVKSASPDSVIIEEFVDGIHFILSLGIECGFDQEMVLEPNVNQAGSLSEEFIKVYELITKFRLEKSYDVFQQLFNQYILIARLLGFTSDQIIQAYLKKNEVNYERQKNGY
ncbi:dUTP diphosphatase [Cytobacillus sp. Hz8]|uniref:dUTP diphosphatase n=1 Tax=Cytobacillus sp. Hz8 TaxID=3347168 RepID=UPI0035DE44D1